MVYRFLLPFALFPVLPQHAVTSYELPAVGRGFSELIARDKDNFRHIFRVMSDVILRQFVLSFV